MSRPASFALAGVALVVAALVPIVIITSGVPVPLGFVVAGVPLLGGAALCAWTAHGLPQRDMRRVWWLYAAGAAIHGATSLAVAVLAATGVYVPRLLALSPLAEGWLAGYLLLVIASVLNYRGRRPEAGWQGLLDGLVIVGALAAVLWQVVIERRIHEAPGGGWSIAVVAIAAALATTAAVSHLWIVVRRGEAAAVWMRLMTLALAAHALATMLLLLGSLEHHLDVVGSYTLVALIALVVSGVGLGAAGWTRRREQSIVATHSLPPSWSRALPVVVAVGAIVPLLLDDPVLGTIALVAILVAGARIMASLSMSERRVAEREAQIATDALTGAGSRAALEVDLPAALARAQRSAAPLAIACIDLDRFKLVNDTLGHRTGDELLRSFVTDVTGALRAGDRLYRQGGDEFVLVMEGTDRPAATRVATRVLATARTAGAWLAPEVGLTASVGVAVAPIDGRDAAGLLAAADAALYRAKAAGRDAIAAWESPAGEDPPVPALV